MASLSYDLVVLGDDFPGLVAACLCASRGMRVLLAQVQRPERSYSFDDESLPLQPGYLAGVSSPAATRVVQELHFEHLFKRRLHPVDPPCQLLTQDIRLDVDSDREVLGHALARELDSDAQWVLDAADALAEMPALLESDACIPPTGFWERRETTKHMDAMHSASESWQLAAASNQASALLDIAVAGMCRSESDLPLTRLHSLQALRQGLTEVEGNADAWRSLFLEKFKNHNGELRRVLPQSVEQRWGKVVGLHTLEDDIRCDFLIAALPIGEVATLFGDKVPKRLSEVAAQVRPAAFRYTLNLLVHLNGLPEGMAPVAWSLLHEGQPATGGNFVSFSTRPAKRSGRAIVTLEAFAPANADGSPDLKGMREAVLDHARARMPFLDLHLEAYDSPHQAPANKHKRDLGGDRNHVPPKALWHCPIDATLKLPALPYTLGAKHLCIANEQTLPTLGLPGEFIAGFSAAKLATAGLGKRKSPVKASVLAHSGS